MNGTRRGLTMACAAILQAKYAKSREAWREAHPDRSRAELDTLALEPHKEAR